MKFLLVILAVMTWTVENKNTVSGAGEMPGSVQAIYANTYQKGDVRQGDTATLVLTNIGGRTIEEIVVYAKSNKTAGAGKFVVNGYNTAGGLTATEEKEGTFRDWTGAYDNSDYHPIRIISKAWKGIDRLEVILIGTTNSLHIERYEIKWVAPESHHVTLRCGNSIWKTIGETSGGEGIVLPDAEDNGLWEFVGWSETEFWEIHVMLMLYQPIHQPGTRFYPQEDCTLWAVYRHYIGHAISYESELEDGIYMYVNSESGEALTGIPVDGKMEAAGVNAYDNQQHYRFEFSEDKTTATITHVDTETPIGYGNDLKMKATASTWNVYHNGEETVFWTTIKGTDYALWLNIMDGNGENSHAGLLKVKSLASSPMRLQPTLVPMPEEIYTCHPEAQGIEITPDDADDLTGERVLMHVGPFDLILKNGKKYLK